MKHILTILIICAASFAQAQDIIITKGGDSVYCKIIDEGIKHIKYKVGDQKTKILKTDIYYYYSGSNRKYYTLQENGYFAGYSTLRLDKPKTLKSDTVIKPYLAPQTPLPTAADHLLLAQKYHYTAVGVYGGAILLLGLGATSDQPDTQQKLFYTGGVIAIAAFIIDLKAWSHFGKASRELRAGRISMSDNGIGVKLVF